MIKTPFQQALSTELTRLQYLVSGTNDSIPTYQRFLQRPMLKSRYTIAQSKKRVRSDSFFFARTLRFFSFFL